MSTDREDLPVYIIYGIIFKEKIEFIGYSAGKRLATITDSLRKYARSQKSAPGFRRLAERMRQCKGAFNTVILDLCQTNNEVELEMCRSKWILQYNPPLNIKDMGDPTKCVDPVTKKQRPQLEVVDLGDGESNAGDVDRDVDRDVDDE